MAEAQARIAEVVRAGRPGSGTAGRDESARAAQADEVALRQMMDRYEQLGGEPPRFNVEANDTAHGIHGAHTDLRHGPTVQMARAKDARTVEGRIYGDDPWERPESQSYRWTDPSTMNRTINDYVRRNWETIRSDLALYAQHRASFDAGRRIGEGYYNSGMYGAGPRDSRYATTSFVTIRIRLVPGADPAEPFIVTAYPSGLL
jgi:hypothetical protein